ncbi:MAG: IgGFc-binding protein, partial [Deltaproteobacteria bacterium]|nr:IgGFc-binding protein [Deltaproteobacteria bacterium]
VYGGGEECPYPDALCVPFAEGAEAGSCYYLCEPGERGTDCPFLATCEPIPDDDEGRGVCQAESDPSMILVPPIEQFRSDYVFLTPDDYEHDYLTVLAPSGTSIHFDGTEVTDLEDVGDVDGTSFATGTVEIPADGTHIVTASAPVGLLVYGYDRYVSYGYPAGLDLEEIGFE